MIPLADTHVHLLAGLDDGPKTLDVALAMCRMLSSQGVRHATALCHQNDMYPANLPPLMQSTAQALTKALTERSIPLAVYPTGEIMLTPTSAEQFAAGTYQTVGGHGKFLLVEMPHGMFVDVLPLASALRTRGVRPIIAHAERYPELLHDPGLTERWIAAGCLIQATAQAYADPWNAADERSLKLWAERGFVHLFGSDGHGIERRPPRFIEGYRRLVKWAGASAAERIGCHWGIAVLQGLPVNVPPPAKPKKNWFTRLMGG